MRLTRPVAVLSLVMSMSLLVGCSGDDDDPGKGEPSSAATGSESPGSDPSKDDDPGSVTKKCQATIAITGEVTADWDGKAEVRLNGNGPKAVYRSANDAGTVTAYSEGEDFKSSVNVIVGDTTYATRPGDDSGLDIGTKGKSAEVDADAFDVNDKSVHVTASFDC